VGSVATIRARAGVALGIVVVATIPAFRNANATAPVARPAGATPSVLLIVTDDQRWDTLWAMPNVRALIGGHGTTFDDAFVVNPLCCPSRSSILTGDYSHTTGVYREKPPFGAFPSFHDGSTIATWLHANGYTTGLFGKYIDAYQHAALTGYVPPGWDRWAAFVRSRYQDYKLTVDGDVRSYGSAQTDYSTNVLGDLADRFIRRTEGPVFVEFAPAAPHAPAIPEPRDAEAFASLPPWRPPSYDEAEVSDKPAYVRDLPRLDPAERSAVDAFRRDQLATLQSMDRQVAKLIDALRDTGRLDDTLIVFTSDNGLSWGEHRWTKKEVPYEESIRVPLVVRFDPLTAGTTTRSSELALNIDIAPTVADAAGIPVATDGRSLLPVLAGAGTAAGWRTRFLIEHMQGTNPVPTYCAVRTERYLYARYATGERELYDLRGDPYEMSDIAGTEPRQAAELQRELDVLCDPEPPGYHPREGAVAAAMLAIASLGLGATIRRRTRVRTR
jgi:arylsulfatase A-like enzyme